MAQRDRPYPVTDREKNRAALREVAGIVTFATAIAFVIWWVWLR